MTTSEIASFYDDGSKAGALIRHSSESLIQTTLVFKGAGGPIIHLFQETRFDTDVRDWSAYTYVDHLENSVLEVRSEALPPRPDLPENPIPSYAAHLVLKDFLATAALRGEFSQFNESDPSAIRAAAFVRHGPENVETPWGSQEALKVTLEIDAREGNTFWCVDGSVVKSDWQGATSYTTKDVDSVMEGLEVAARVRKLTAVVGCRVTHARIHALQLNYPPLRKSLISCPILEARLVSVGARAIEMRAFS